MTNPSGNNLYTCPMHLEVRREGPATCPKCGMTLEPVVPEVSKGKVEYTCPMHPEIRQEHPGSCPKYGMTLVLRNPVAGDVPEENEELKNMTRRFSIEKGGK